MNASASASERETENRPRGPNEEDKSKIRGMRGKEGKVGGKRQIKKKEYAANVDKWPNDHGGLTRAPFSRRGP